MSRTFTPLLAAFALVACAAWIASPELTADDAPAPAAPTAPATPRRPRPAAAPARPTPNARLLESVNGQAHRDLAYVENGHERQKLDLYIPGNVEGPLPLVCWIHGGGWQNGSKDGCRALPLLAEGYAVASIGYRLTDAAPFPAQIEDCKAAIRWIRAHASEYGIDPGRIGVWGSSAGGHLVALLGTSGDVSDLEGALGNNDQSSRVQAVCDYYGPSDFLLRGVGGDEENPAGPVAKLLGGPTSQRQDVARAASPAHWISADDPPFLIFHGDQDRTVPLEQSTSFNDLLKKAGIESELVVFPGAGHGGEPFGTPETNARIAAFFDRHLRPAGE